METELDIRLDVTGLHIKNKAEMIEEIDKSITTLSEILEIDLTDNDIYKAYKDARKIVKDERNKIWNDIKEKVADIETDILADRKELYGKYDDIYKKLDDAIHAYETENEIGSVKAKMTRDNNKKAADAATSNLVLTLQCPNELAKQRIIQFAQDLGATVI